MSDVLSALLVIFFIVIPGMAGNAVYTRVAGRNWRNEPWRNLVRVFSFSLGGLILYVLLGSLVNAPLPGYLSLDNLDTLALRRTASIRMSFAFIGHLLAAVLVGFVAAKANQMLGKWPGRSVYADSWHEFASGHANGQWVVVGVKGGGIYAGYLQMAAPDRNADERDVVLAEPSVYRTEQEKYYSLPYQYLFLPGKTVDSVAIASNQPESHLSPMLSAQEENKNGR